MREIRNFLQISKQIVKSKLTKYVRTINMQIIYDFIKLPLFLIKENVSEKIEI